MEAVAAGALEEAEAAMEAAEAAMEAAEAAMEQGPPPRFWAGAPDRFSP